MLASCCRDLTSGSPKASFSDRFHCANPEVVSRALKSYILNTKITMKGCYSKNQILGLENDEVHAAYDEY